MPEYDMRKENSTHLVRLPARSTHTSVKFKWQRAAAGDWGAYAAEVSRRNSKA
ncbi:hypothetical protein [Streptomyces chiangmaiensis]|uniref:Uncharacterized protein n=1 Tax=Streptomyces chiangmaiensis TaxID=766497 RepID=A0ABU7FQG1_9ACTN|nr:hypothetical protein [Streptomyces chiangmaiensis]MED7826213.1 hypothetical protein [Streptomyces chiangmaiensis]